MKNEKLSIAIIVLVTVIVIITGGGLLLNQLADGRIKKSINSLAEITEQLEINQSKLEKTTRNISKTTAGIDKISRAITEQNNRIAEFYKSVGDSSSKLQVGLSESGERIDRIKEILQNAENSDDSK